MLALRPSCENCNKALPPHSTEAMICTYECTFCRDCVNDIMQNVCPNCGGGFTPRPIRPKDGLAKYPPSQKVVHKPVDMESFQEKLNRFKSIPPEKR
ncbi:DUF1272 domain-containing protein [Sediminicola luteus]|uniref:Urease n=1 Tax=Sediminicola luteus TaxID=319238 RepID=A0A2A4GAD8_9FLAO|nr:DUF1272 domain-containing protein [Sediminicola luteus]PCE64715.1 hypothetical protein B7P33_05960 [Sediminicola luteus]